MLPAISLPQKKLVRMGIVLLILAIADALFTDFGIQNNHITESNPLMRNVYNGNIHSFYLLKIALPILLIYIVAKMESRPFIQTLLSIAIFIYVIVLMLHFLWLSLAFLPH